MKRPLQFACVLAAAIMAASALFAQDAPARMYRVAAGDSWPDIAARTLLDYRLWPACWSANRAQFPDPDILKAGVQVKIPEPTTDMDASYLEVYEFYAAAGEGRAKARRWVLSEAESVLPGFAGRHAGRIAKPDAAASVAKPVPQAPAERTGGAVQADILALMDRAAKASSDVDAAMLDKDVAMLDRSGRLDEVIAGIERVIMEAEAAGKPVLPGIRFTLAAAYGRKDLIARAYTEIEKAEAAAALPGIVFSLAALYGRKELLKANLTVDQLIPGGIAITSTPEGARVWIDEVDRGLAPLAFDALAGPHNVRMELENHAPALQTVEVKAGQIASIDAQLVPYTGSIRVVTNPSGAMVILDGNPDAIFETPCTFEKVLVGSHELSVYDVLVNGKYLTSERDEAVIVRIDEETVVERTLVQGKATLIIPDAPNGLSLFINGESIVSDTVFATGMEVDAGKLDVRLVSPIGQEWRQSLSLWPGNINRCTLESMVNAIPLRTIAVDGKTDDWSGIEAIWKEKRIQKVFPNQPGTSVQSGFLCRDATYLYYRVDFADGSPTIKVGPDFSQRLVYTVRAMLDGANILPMDIFFDRSAGASTALSIYNSSNRTGSGVGDGKITYKIVDGVLEARIALSMIGKYLVNTPRMTEFCIANVDTKGTWVKEWKSGRVFVDYGK